jgi:hypothetical protein
MALHDEGPPACIGLDTPDQGVDQGPSWLFSVEINPNILPLDLSLLLKF